MNSEARSFRESQRYQLQPNMIHASSRNKQMPREIYRGPKLTKEKIKKIKSRRRLTVLGIGALLLSSMVGMTGLKVVGALEDRPIKNTITQMQEKGIDMSKLGLAEDTIQNMQVYDRYFESLDLENIYNTDDEIIKVIEGIKEVSENVIKDKMVKLSGKDRDSISVRARNEELGSYGAVEFGEISIDIGTSKERRYIGVSNIIGIGQKDHIASDISDYILQLSDFDGLIVRLKDDRITKVNAIKELRNMYKDTCKMASKQFTMDEKGNIETKEINQQAKNEKELGE